MTMNKKISFVVVKALNGAVRGRIIASRPGLASAAKLPDWRFQGVAYDVTIENPDEDGFVVHILMHGDERKLVVLHGQVSTELSKSLESMIQYGEPGYEEVRSSFEPGAKVQLGEHELVNVAS